MESAGDLEMTLRDRFVGVVGLSGPLQDPRAAALGDRPSAKTVEGLAAGDDAGLAGPRHSFDETGIEERRDGDHGFGVSGEGPVAC